MAKKAPTYPKRYVTLIAYRDRDPNSWGVEYGRVVNKRIQGVWTLRDEAGEEFEAVYPRFCGEVPDKLYSDYRAWNAANPPKKKDKETNRWYKFLIETGVKFKFFQRDQDAGRWSYRHMGE